MFIILYYCLKVIICSGLLFGYYLLALRNNRFHQWNRFYLLAAVFISFTLPFVKIALPFFSSGDEPVVIQSFRIVSAPDIYFSRLRSNSFAVTWPMLLGISYSCIALFLITVFIRNVLKVQKLKKVYPAENLNGIQFYNTLEPGTPFSFFKNIFWNSNISLSNEKGQQMLRHEITHIQEKHSVDKVAMELLITIAWWNPFLYYIRKELSVIHEFIADQKASAGDAKLQYASLLLMKAMGSDQYALGNPFFHSQLKRRLTMLTTITNPKFSYMRRLLALPLAVLALILFSFKYKESQKEKEKNKKLEIQSPSLKTTATEPLNVHAFYQDTAKKKANITTEKKYKGKFIESITPTTDRKGIIVKTTDKEVYFLNREEAKKELDVIITDKVFIAPPGARVIATDDNGVPADSYSNVPKENLRIENGSIEIRKSGSSENFEKSLVILDGVEIDFSKLKELNVQNFERMDVLKGEQAVAKYGDKGKNGVVVITTKKAAFPDDALYIIDGKEGSKKDFETLFTIQKDNINWDIDIIDGQQAVPKYGDKGKNGVIVITTKKSGAAAISQKPDGPLLREVTVTDYQTKKDKVTGTGQQSVKPEVTVTGYQLKNDVVFAEVETPATFPGGIDGWRRYLEKSLQYPKAAQEKGTQGAVQVQMVVDVDGNIIEMKVIKEPGNGLGEEAMRVLKKGPKWVPAMQNGKPVAYRFVQTITFQLQ